MTLRHMTIFVKVCELDSVTKAAEKMHISQPAISLAIKELETYYSVPLFDRLGRKLHLTQKGRQLLDYALHITALFEELDRNMQETDTSGTIRVGSSVTIGTHMLPKLLAEFAERFPDSMVQVTIDKSELIEERILNNELDFALIEGFCHYEQLADEAIWEDHLCIVCNPSHPLSAKQTVSIDEFKSCAFLLREHGSGTRELIDSTLIAHGISINPKWESISTEAIVNGIRHNLGISILPYSLIRPHIVAKRLHILQVEQLDFKRYFRIIYHRNKYLSRAAKEFILLSKQYNQKDSDG